MFETFRRNIQELFHWNDEQFDCFTTKWLATLELHIVSRRPALVYGERYMESLLSLFFVLKQQDLNLKRYFINERAVFLALVTFYIVEDLKMSFQTKNSLVCIASFLELLKSEKLITTQDVKYALGILHMFGDHLNSESADILNKDVSIVNDIIVFNNPVVVLNKACMFYYGEPFKMFFKYKKEDVHDLNANLFFDQSFKNSQKINNSFIKQLYTENLHHLMDVQSSKQIFPF